MRLSFLLLVALWIGWVSSAGAQYRHPDMGGLGVPGGRRRPDLYRRGGFFSTGGSPSSHAHGAGPLAVGGALLVTVLIVLASTDRRGRRGMPSPTSPRWNGVDMVRLRIALDGRARARMPFLELPADAMKRERQAALQGIVQALRRERTSWQAARIDDFRPTSPPVAEARFRTMAAHAREAQAQSVSASTDDEAGVVLVTLLVASQQEIVDVGKTNAETVERVLEALLGLRKNDLVAFDFVWAPQSESEQLSTENLSAGHPGLTTLR